MNTKDSLGDRMKAYEDCYRIKLTPKSCIIIRLDGKAFHSLTKDMTRPFDEKLATCMKNTALYLCENISGAKFGYVYSDEISILITDYDELTTQAWFDNNLQKIVSISASMATHAFNRQLEFYFPNKEGALFDTRAFILPKEEVVNYFIWRQQDCTRNSIQMAARSQFSHKECYGKNQSELQDMLILKKQINWNDYLISNKRGTALYKVIKTFMAENKKTKEEIEVTRPKWFIDVTIPIFTQDRQFIERYV